MTETAAQGATPTESYSNFGLGKPEDRPGCSTLISGLAQPSRFVAMRSHWVLAMWCEPEDRTGLGGRGLRFGVRVPARGRSPRRREPGGLVGGAAGRAGNYRGGGRGDVGADAPAGGGAGAAGAADPGLVGRPACGADGGGGRAGGRGRAG